MTGDYPRLMAIWESAVLATHHFLLRDDFDLFKSIIPTTYFPKLKIYTLTTNDQISAFFAVSENNLEMLFVDPINKGIGLGSLAINYIIHQLHIYNVDVNEQNQSAVKFYLNRGYQIIGKSERDGTGKPYPLLHLEYNARI